MPYGTEVSTFAVGTLIAERPPHRSERAQFGHSRTCRLIRYLMKQVARLSRMARAGSAVSFSRKGLAISKG